MTEADILELCASRKGVINSLGAITEVVVPVGEYLKLSEAVAEWSRQNPDGRKIVVKWLMAGPQAQKSS